jgi:hypothetical protein
MSNIIETLSSFINEDQVGTNLYGDKYIKDLRSAGEVAQEAGKRFENITKAILIEENVGRYNIIPQPPYICHYGLKRKLDFGLESEEKFIFVECKQLGDVQSHLDKISRHYLDVIQGCYGKYFWIVYDFNREKQNRTKIDKFILESKRIKEHVALQGITFECILIDELPNYLKGI